MGFGPLNYVSTGFPGQIQCSASLEIVNRNRGRVSFLTDLKAAFDVGITGSLGLRLYPHKAPLPEVAKVLLETRIHPIPGILACLGYFALAPPSFPYPSLQ